MPRRDIGFLARTMLRTQVRRAIRSGKLPADASIVLDDDDAFETLCESVGDRSERVGAIGDGKILNWITANLPWILQVVMAILQAFNVPVPDLPPFPTPTPSAADFEYRVGTVAELAELGPPEWVARMELELKSLNSKVDKLLNPIELT